MSRRDIDYGINLSKSYIIYKLVKDGQVFYIGKTKNLNTRSNQHRINFKLTRYHGFSVGVVKDNLSELGAHFLEHWVIGQYIDKGAPLINKALNSGGYGHGLCLKYIFYSKKTNKWHYHLEHGDVSNGYALPDTAEQEAIDYYLRLDWLKLFNE